MKSDKDGNYIGISVGKNMINGDEVIVQVIILKRNKTTNRFKVYLRIDMIALELTSICKRIYFDFDESECLIFATANEIIQYNFMKKTKT